MQHPPQNMADCSVLCIISRVAPDLCQEGVGLWRHTPGLWTPRISKSGCLQSIARAQTLQAAVFGGARQIRQLLLGS